MRVLCILILFAVAFGATMSTVLFAEDDPENTHQLQRFDVLPSELEGAERHQIRTEQVFLPDERVQISPATEIPYRTIANLEILDGPNILGCTGTFIGRQVLLTAAHCVYDPDGGGWVDAVAASPGQDGASRPFGYDYVDLAWVPDGWILTGGTEWDWALLHLPSPTLGDTVGHLTLLIASDATLASSSLTPVISGYPGDKPLGTQWHGQKPSLLSFDETFLAYDIDTYGGQSGSAIWRASDERIVGVHRGALVDTFNLGNRVRQLMIDQMQAACASMGCTFSWEVENTVPLSNRVYLPAIFRNATNP